MKKIVARKILEGDLKSSYGNEEFNMIFTGDKNFYISNKDGTPIKVSDFVIVNKKTELVNGIRNKFYYVTDDKKLYFFNGIDFIELTNGKNGNSEDIDLSKYMLIEKYDKDNLGMVDFAQKVDGVIGASPLTYYGKDKLGNIGFHHFPVGDDKESNGLYTRVKLNAKKDLTFIIDLKNKKPDNDIIVQAFKFVSGQKDLTTIFKDFDNSDKGNFFYNENEANFDKQMELKNKFEYELKPNRDFFETEVIDFSLFKDIEKIEII